MPSGGLESTPTAVYRRISSPSTIGKITVGFLLLIVVGTLLLQLPVSTTPGNRVGWLDSLFVATSAACVTGLSTVNIGEVYSRFGQAVLLGLIQVGGLGIMTVGTLFLLFRGRGLSSRGEDFISSQVGRLRNARPVDIFIYAFLIVLVWEALGTMALTYLLLENEPELPVGQAVWEAAFHAVSAFCNAGISTYPEGLVRWADRPAALAVVVLLVVAGGIGFMTLVNFRYYYWWRRDRLRRGQLTLQTRICLAASVFLLVWGALTTWVTELGHSFQGQPWWRQAIWALFHSAMTRTAGFNVVDLGDMAPASLLGSIPLMFIGGAPGSMAGGVKVTTFVLLVASTVAALRRRSDLVVGRNTLSANQAHAAVMMVVLAGFVLLLGVALLMRTEESGPASAGTHHWLAVAFEAVSALCTVGLSTGITSELSSAGKGVVIVLMFLGRLGPLFLAMHLTRPAGQPKVGYPEQEITMG